MVMESYDLSVIHTCKFNNHSIILSNYVLFYEMLML